MIKDATENKISAIKIHICKTGLTTNTESIVDKITAIANNTKGLKLQNFLI